MTTTGTMTGRREQIVPLVSSDTAGPLGAIHLPRLWAKLTLAAAGRLPEGYDECGPGFDQMVLTNFGLDRQKTMEYVRNNKPTYMQFEQWIVQQNGGSIPQDKIRKHNDAVRAYCHGDDLAKNMRAASGISDSGVSDAVTLNKLEDLDEFHRQVTAK